MSFLLPGMSPVPICDGCMAPSFRWRLHSPRLTLSLVLLFTPRLWRPCPQFILLFPSSRVAGFANQFIKRLGLFGCSFFCFSFAGLSLQQWLLSWSLLMVDPTSCTAKRNLVRGVQKVIFLNTLLCSPLWSAVLP